MATNNSNNGKECHRSPQYTFISTLTAPQLMMKASYRSVSERWKRWLSSQRPLIGPMAASRYAVVLSALPHIALPQMET
jgi:hypothetical protein